MRCPRCKTPLVKEVGDGGVVYACPTCRGRSVGMAVLRRRFEKDAVNDLWRRARGAPRRGEAACPACGLPMTEVGVHRGARETIVDACSFCFLLWFDFDELEMLPEKPPPPAPWKPSPLAAEAQVRMESAAEKDAIVEEIDPWSMDGLRGWLGLPQKLNAPERSVIPWVTYALGATVLAVTLWPVLRGWLGSDTTSWREVQKWADAWGFVPSMPFRHGGLTTISSFFLHGGLLHAAGNLYFLALAGEDVEGLLGRGRYLLLLLASTVVGDLMYAAFTPHSTVPLIGASGGVSGLLGWYALAFPRVRVGVVLTMSGYGLARTTWRFPTAYRVRIPVRVMLVLWLALQTLWMLAARGGIAYGAHVSGALVGVAWWAIARARAPRSL